MGLSSSGNFFSLLNFKQFITQKNFILKKHTFLIRDGKLNGVTFIQHIPDYLLLSLAVWFKTALSVLLEM